MDNNLNGTEFDERTGGEAFLDIAQKQAMYNFINGDKDSLRVCREVEKEKQKFKPLFKEAELEMEKNKETKNGRSKR